MSPKRTEWALVDRGHQHASTGVAEQAPEIHVPRDGLAALVVNLADRDVVSRAELGAVEARIVSFLAPTTTKLSWPYLSSRS